MTTPVKLTNAPSCVTVDGIDLHSFGMIVNSVSNPPPGAKSVSVSMPNRDGDVDFTKYYNTRTITLSGSIIGDNTAQLLANIDAANTYFRLRKNGQAFKVVFQNQTDRYWTCKYNSFQYPALGNWFTGHIVSFTLSLKCTKPYAESTSITTESFLLNSLRNKKITYPGTLPAPLIVELTAKPITNLISSVTPSTDNAAWSLDITNKIYGTYSDKATRSSAGAFDMYYNFSAYDKNKYYVCGAYVYYSGLLHAKLRIELVSTRFDSDFVNNYSGQWSYTFLKVSPAQMAASSQFALSIMDDGSESWMSIDGVFIYEITAAEYADANYIPPPFIGSSYPNVVNAAINLHKSLNIFPIENGDYVAADWSGYLSTTQRMASSCDPLGGADRCFLFTSPLSTYSCVYAPAFYVSGSKYYKISFDYYVEKIGALPFAINFSNYIESLGFYSYVFSASAETSGWVTYTTELQANPSAQSIRLKLECNSLCKVYIKNIQIIEEDAQGEPFDAYQRPDASETVYNSTLESDDSVIIDADKFIGEVYDSSAACVSNAMSSLNIGSMLLQPGYNCLRYSDARKGATTPEIASAGAVNAKISYRARYL